jgi:hypothetical protein
MASSSSKIRIRVKDKSARAGIVHGSVWRQSDFYWEPMSFVLESPKLDSRIIEASAQEESLAEFWAKPNTPMIYVVAGNPDDSKAKYFAAYLASHHKATYQHRADIIWEAIFGGYDNPLLRKEVEPSMLILSNLAENSTAAKIEKAKDLVERFPNIPRVIVVAGTDPVSFAATMLHVPAHGICYISSALVNSVQQVI